MARAKGKKGGKCQAGVSAIQVPYLLSACMNAFVVVFFGGKKEKKDSGNEETSYARVLVLFLFRLSGSVVFVLVTLGVGVAFFFLWRTGSLCMTGFACLHIVQIPNFFDQNTALTILIRAGRGKSLVFTHSSKRRLIQRFM